VRWSGLVGTEKKADRDTFLAILSLKQIVNYTCKIELFSYFLVHVSVIGVVLVIVSIKREDDHLCTWHGESWSGLSPMEGITAWIHYLFFFKQGQKISPFD
jgi:hypothetical protein